MRTIHFLVILILMSAVYAELSPGEDCAGMYDVCAADCEDECEMTKYEYCQEHGYSGCALDVFCYCNVCNIYDSKWCPEYSDYRACAEGIKGTYTGCIKTCQSKREAGSDVSTCWADCNKIFDEKLTECKQVPCHDFCIEKGYETGEWARYTQEYGWDSCLCENKIRDPVPDEPIGEPEHYQELESDEPTASAEIDTDSGIVSKIKWLFSKQPVVTRTITARITGVLNKAGISVFREKQNKWTRAGSGTSLYPGDMLKIGDKSRARIEVLEPNGGRRIVDLLPNTIYTAYSTDPNLEYSGQYPVSVITKGIVKVMYRRLTGQKPELYHKTPTVVLGIRGTEFILGHDNETNTDILMVYEGEVEVQGNGDLVIVEAGSQIKFNDGTEGEKQDLDTEEWEALTKDIEYEELYTPSFFSIPIVRITGAIVIVIIMLSVLKKRKKKKRKK
ncbi:hypothetical protein JW930_01980 [Candidatus Woesearchaeota archaeon]|nr:hypothetical protein [Candidatus Woesearchaeota archaeon]